MLEKNWETRTESEIESTHRSRRLRLKGGVSGVHISFKIILQQGQQIEIYNFHKNAKILPLGEKKLWDPVR